MYNGSLPVGLGLISHVLLKTNLKYLKVSYMRKKLVLVNDKTQLALFFRNLKNTFNRFFTGSRLHDASLSILFNAKAQLAFIKQ